MRSAVYGLLVVVGVAAVLIAVRDSRPAARSGPAWEVRGDDRWADPDEARRAEDLSASQDEVTARVSEKLALIDQLIRGERTLDAVADRFRELNAGCRNAYLILADAYPTASEEELAYRQVVLFVRASKPYSTLVAAVLPRLEAEVTRRFPPAAAGPRA